MSIDYKQYPPNWDKIRAGILKRAGSRCECCGVQNLIRGWRDDSGVFIPGENDKKRCFMIVLTVSHTNHNINDNRPENLRALCQKCHLEHDRSDNANRRFQNQYDNTDNLL